MERDSRGPKINANCINGLIREEWDRLMSERDAHEDYAIGRLQLFAGTIVEGLTPEQILNIARNDGELFGNTYDGVEYRDVDKPPKCPECGGELYLLRGEIRTMLHCGTTDCDYTWEIK